MVRKAEPRGSLLGVSCDRSRDWARELHFLGQRTDEIDSGNCNEFADLLQAKINLATRNRLADQLACDLLGRDRHLAFYSQRLEQYRRYIDAAGTFRVTN